MGDATDACFSSAVSLCSAQGNAPLHASSYAPSATMSSTTSTSKRPSPNSASNSFLTASSFSAERAVPRTRYPAARRALAMWEPR